MRCSSRRPGRGFRTLLHLGFTDAVRALNPASGFTPSGTTRPAPGRRTTASASIIALLSPQAADRLVGCRIDKHVRGWEKPSDHVPVVIELDVTVELAV
jgi:exodeoxyribonuclease III